jgi:hypothetical protein
MQQGSRREAEEREGYGYVAVSDQPVAVPTRADRNGEKGMYFRPVSSSDELKTK